MLYGCTPTLETHGHSLDEAQIAKIRPNSTSRQEVLQLMGSPSALVHLRRPGLVLCKSAHRKKSFYQEGLIEQEVVTIRFDDQNRVIAVDRHGLDQMAAIDPVDRITPTAGTSPSIFKELIGNIGRFSNSATDPDG